MADSTNSPNKPIGDPEPSMEKRMLLAFLIMGAILFATPYFYRVFLPPPKTPPKPAAQTVTPAPPPAEAAKQTAEEAAEPQAAHPAVSAEKEQLQIIDTDLFRITFSNRGAVVRSWVLKKYRDSAGDPLDLVSPAGSAKSAWPFSLDYKDKKPSVDLNAALYGVQLTPDGLGISFEYSDGRTVAEKTFQFQKKNYLAQFTSRVAENGTGIQHLLTWRGGFGDAAVQNAASRQRVLFFDSQANKLVTEDPKAAKNGPVDKWGPYTFAGVEDNYFAAVFLPKTGTELQVRTVDDNVPAAPNAKEEPHVGGEVGGATHNIFALFVGPKDLDLLRTIDRRLELLVDFGTWFGWLAKPLFLILNWLNDHLVHNYGWSIALVTILINTALMPLRFSSMKSMKRMQALQPQIQTINAKYKGVGLRDPKNQEKNAEIMELYKKNGINPMGGCLPMLLQVPFFIAFYSVLSVAIEMRGASWLWVSDLSQPEHLPIRILPIAMIIAQFVQQKMTPNPSADPSQQRMMMFMPLIFGFMFYSVSSGLVLYWLTSNLVGIVQQYFINKTMGGAAAQPVAVPAAPAAPKRKTGSRR